MNSFTLRARCGALCAVAAALGACATKPPSQPEAAAVPPATISAPSEAPPPRDSASATPPAPGPASPAAQQQAHKMALAAVVTLEAGQEEQARAELQRALVLDPQSRLALSLLRQINEPVIAPRESFSYTVRPGDSLSSIAERFMGDKFLFYALARFNDLKVPRQLSSGQSLRVPGKGPALAEREARERERERDAREPRVPARTEMTESPRKAPATAVAPVPAPAPAPLPVPVVAPATTPLPLPTAAPEPSVAERALTSAEAAERAGELERALSESRRATGLDAGSAPAARLAALNKRLAARYAANARGDFARQDLDGAIRHWDRVLQLDPGNDTARLERQRAVDLKRKVEALK
ncbi:M23 family metallopeptidase [Azohydromonas aeria]|uniref:M23 family metallopeptidase n=1 Tax=Azohydromonas aeria TaxID=2590212 RepID=UPI0012F8B8A9|nr:LysM peptidoglycan-binding domain-containing protein [Azohydromonas aeria]